MLLIAKSLVAISVVLFVFWFFANDKQSKKISGICAVVSLLIAALSFFYDVDKDFDKQNETVQKNETESTLKNKQVTKIINSKNVQKNDINYLYKMEYYQSSKENNGAFKIYDSVKDNTQNIYSNAIGGIDGYGENWQEYKINKEYKLFKGKIILDYNSRSQNYNNSYVKIYGDDISLWVSPLISAGQMPVEFNIDISKIDNLKIVIFGSKAIRIVDCGLYKSFDNINEKEPTSDIQWKNKVNLYELDYFNSSNTSGNGFDYKDYAKDNLGIEYTNCMIGKNSYSENWQDYYIDSHYSELQGRIILNYDSRSANYKDSYVKIYGDNSIIYTSPPIISGIEPIDISLNISGIKVIRVSVTGRNNIGLVDWILYEDSNNPVFSSAIKTNKEKNQIALASMEYFDASGRNGGFKIHSVVNDNLGNVYADGIGGINYDENWEVYKLNGQYKQLKGVIVLDFNARSAKHDDTYVKIYGDDNLLYTSGLITAGKEPEPFFINIENIDKLKISFKRYDTIRLVNTYLYK